MRAGQVIANNELDVDNDELAAEAAAVPLPSDSTPQSDVDGAAASGQPDAAGTPAPASWAPLTPPIFEAVDLFVCPAWKLTAQEKAALADALAPVLDRLFPGGVSDERWAPYFRLLLVAGGVVAMRYDRTTGKLQPMRAKPKNDSAPSDRTADDVPGVGGSYTTVQ